MHLASGLKSSLGFRSPKKENKNWKLVPDIKSESNIKV